MTDYCFVYHLVKVIIGSPLAVWGVTIANAYEGLIVLVKLVL